MATTYEKDIVAWAHEQALLLRTGQLSGLDIEHIAEEIEDVGKGEQRELASRMALLLFHLLKWQYQPARQCTSWVKTIKEQRKALERRLKKTPSLKSTLIDPEWWDDVWLDARTAAENETGVEFEKFPEQCPWPIDNILLDEWLPQTVNSGMI
jgi:hypothetical protein